MPRARANTIAVQLFRRLPWLRARWARHHRFVESATIPWTPLAQPVAESRVALVTTAGVHLRSDPPFDMADGEGDPTSRLIPASARAMDLTITHRYYDHAAADRDINVVLPLDRLRELHRAGVVGEIAPRHASFMGHIDGRHLDTLIRVTAPALARLLVADGVKAAVFTPA